MGRYMLRRLLTALLTVALVTVLNFLLMRLAPGDPVQIIAGMNNPSAEQMAALTERYGLNKPLGEQLWIYIKQLAGGDMGTSYTYNQPVASLIGETMSPSMLLALTSCVLAFVLGTAIGLVCARHEGKALDNIMSSVSYLFDSMPPFWLGLIMILFFASTLHWLPTSGMVNLRSPATGWGHVVDVMTHLTLPCATMTLIQIPQ